MRRESAVWLVAREPRRRGPQLAAFAQQLNVPLRVFEARVAELGQRHPALVELERLFDRQVAALFELLDDGVQLADGCFEVLDHLTPETLAAIVPRLNSTCTVSPFFTSAASRMACVRSSFQQTAYPRPSTLSGLSESSRPASAPSRACESWARRVMPCRSFASTATSVVRLRASRRLGSNASRRRSIACRRRARTLETARSA